MLLDDPRSFIEIVLATGSVCGGLYMTVLKPNLLKDFISKEECSKNHQSMDVRFDKIQEQISIVESRLYDAIIKSKP